MKGHEDKRVNLPKKKQQIWVSLLVEEAPFPGIGFVE